jgi:uncharacterized protein YecT (DUF1311 family)
MKQLKILAVIILSGHSFLSFAQTQTQLTADSEKRRHEAEINLAFVYNKILETYQGDQEFIKNLKESQDIWIKFRTTELKTKYPDRKSGYYGSTHRMCVNDYLTELTNERIKRLQTWLTGAIEGDVCCGSIKPRE